MFFEKYVAGGEKNAAYLALWDAMQGFDTDKSYADMMRLRISGGAAKQCYDAYYVAHENGKMLSRHWMGYGKHGDAIGNWGNFFTSPEARGRGIGSRLLEVWYEDLKTTPNLPDCFMCTTSEPWLVRLYRGFGFRPAIRGRDGGPLYMPVGNSPESFAEFADSYYTPSPVLYLKPASIGYRHEIDCLLRFWFVDNGLDIGIRGVDYMEKALLYFPERAGMLFSEDGHCVGWSIDGEIQAHPLYAKSEIIRATH